MITTSILAQVEYLYVAQEPIDLEGSSNLLVLEGGGKAIKAKQLCAPIVLYESTNPSHRRV